MAGTFLGKYDTTAANNTATGTGSVSVAEGMLPSNINNAFRDIMADIRQHYNNAEWIEYGDAAGTYTATYASSTSFTIDGSNVTAIYHAGRRVKVTATTPGTIYGTIASTSFSTNTTVTVVWDSGSLSDEAITSVYIGAITATNTSLPKTINAAHINTGVVSNAEFNYLNGVSSAIQTQLDAKQATITGSATTIDTESLTASRALISNGSQKVAVSAVTDTELGYLDGVSSAIQTQLAAKAATTYVDNAVAGLRTRIICEAASTANVVISSALEAGDAIDGVTLVSGDQVLLKDQSTASQNGIYTAVGSGAGAASRSTNFDAIAEISGQMVVINQGTANDNTLWLCTTNSSASLGSDSISFTKITPQNVGDVTLTGTQTLTNKTLTAPVLSGSTSTAGSILFKEDTDNGTNSVTLKGAASTADVTLTLPNITGELIPGKTAGTNFTGSLLVGHATTGTLSSASQNTGVGLTALDALTSGDNNVAVGYGALTAATTSRYNVAIGHNAGETISTSADYNVCIGQDGGDNITTGHGNIAIGAAARVASATGDLQLKISSHDGAGNTAAWITGDSSGNVIHAGTTHAAGGQLTTTGKSLVMGF